MKKMPSFMDDKWCMSWIVGDAIDYRPMRWYEKVFYFLIILEHRIRK